VTHDVLLTRLVSEPRRRGLRVVLVGPELYERATHAGYPQWTPGGANTWEEAQRIVRANLPDCTLVTSVYHQLRAFLTLLRAAQDVGAERTLRIWNDPAPSTMAKLPQELEKIALYQKRGHVASYEEGMAYLDWRDTCG
jgi:hypothetical protein